MSKYVELGEIILLPQKACFQAGKKSWGYN